MDAKIESDDDDADDNKDDEEEDEDKDEDDDDDVDSTLTYAPGSRNNIYRRSENINAARVTASGRDARASIGS